MSPSKRWIGSRSTDDLGFVTRASRSRPLSFALALVALTGGPALAQPRPAPSRPAPAPAPAATPTAAELAKQGTERYQAGDYAGAVPLLARAYELEPSSDEYRFALAQALRMSGNCDEAVPHYEALIDSTLSPDRARDILKARELCPDKNAQALPPPPPALPPPPPPPPPAASGFSRQDVGLMVGAGAGLTAGVLLFAGSLLDRGDAESARSAEEHDRISRRANLWLTASIITGGAGVALGVISVMRYRAKHRGTELAVSPRPNGGVAVVLEGSF